MYRIRYALIPVLLCFVAASRAALVYNTDFSMISFLDGATGDSGGVNASTLQIFSGFAELQLSDTAESFPGFSVPPGCTTAQGRSHQTGLKASVRLEGASIRQFHRRETGVILPTRRGGPWVRAAGFRIITAGAKA